ncbi:hypothetical protein N5P37_000303 [Trichoderma harzianum]|uniref:RRM domain-containing protein n=1 Tax=Trichoderma harzianum CBS 226.95 TaxID=983964 RepID=A0A2T4AH62_TRIHA|nr:hypothetical protein M431DRAFT_3598 [Trichoderma harzianum CBS 226.95]KAK0766578.1 hypothetical protein N5P37_000303 [Trichoderma harzianum]PKK40821.1 hypothetical protein CI102_14920 [Trichoderma harzianum]PTB56430.1 hypothetical protein M431DRAFT_3598 [Trichoderma harzianum CBS 226.95]
MAPRDAQFEARIELYRRERRLLVAKNIYWEATRAEFETAVRAKLTMGDTVSFVWPRQTDWRFRRNTKRHRGYAFIVFNTRPDAQRAVRELRPFDFCGRRVRIEIAGREAFVSGPEYAQVTPAPATAASTAAAVATTPAPAPAAAATAATPPAATNRTPSDSNEEPRTSWW